MLERSVVLSLQWDEQQAADTSRSFALPIGLSHTLQAAGHALAMLGSRAAGSIHSISVICFVL